MEYFRTLSLKFQKARTKIEVVLTLPCWLSQASAKLDTKLLIPPNVDRIVRFELLFLACLGFGAETKCTVHVALPKRPINYFKLDQLFVGKNKTKGFF